MANANEATIAAGFSFDQLTEELESGEINSIEQPFSGPGHLIPDMVANYGSDDRRVIVRDHRGELYYIRSQRQVSTLFRSAQTFALQSGACPIHVNNAGNVKHDIDGEGTLQTIGKIANWNETAFSAVQFRDREFGAVKMYVPGDQREIKQYGEDFINAVSEAQEKMTSAVEEIRTDVESGALEPQSKAYEQRMAQAQSDIRSLLSFLPVAQPGLFNANEDGSPSPASASVMPFYQDVMDVVRGRKSAEDAASSSRGNQSGSSIADAIARTSEDLAATDDGGDDAGDPFSGTDNV